MLKQIGDPSTIEEFNDYINDMFNYVLYHISDSIYNSSIEFVYTPVRTSVCLSVLTTIQLNYIEELIKEELLKKKEEQ